MVCAYPAFYGSSGDKALLSEIRELPDVGIFPDYVGNPHKTIELDKTILWLAAVINSGDSTTSMTQEYRICPKHKVRMKPVGNGFECPVCSQIASQQRGRRRR